MHEHAKAEQEHLYSALERVFEHNLTLLTVTKEAPKNSSFWPVGATSLYGPVKCDQCLQEQATLGGPAIHDHV